MYIQGRYFSDPLFVEFSAFLSHHVVEVFINGFGFKVQVTNVKSLSNEIQEQLDAIVHEVVASAELNAAGVITHGSSEIRNETGSQVLMIIQ